MITLGQKTFFNDIFESIKCTKDLTTTLEFAEYIASVERAPLSIDFIISAILFYYRDEDSQNEINQLYSASKYYEYLKNETEKSAFEISFSSFSAGKPTQYYCPHITPDVQTLFSHLYAYKDDTITIPTILFVICKICKYNIDEFEKAPIIYSNPSKFKTLYSILKKEIAFEDVYSTELKIDFGTDLTYKAFNKKFDKIIGRSSELKQILRILTKRTKNNPLLVGEPGVGKTHIIEALASLFVAGNVPNRLYQRRIISLNTSEITAGTKYRGDLEENIKIFISQVKEENAIVFIDEIHTICCNSAKDSASFADILKPYLLDSDISVIGATTTEEYRSLEKDRPFKRRFDVVKINEPTISEAIEILQGLKPIYEDFHDVIIPDDVIVSCVQLSDRYISATCLPDKAIDVLDEACAELESQVSVTPLILTTEDVCKIIFEKTGIPINSIKSDEKLNLIHLEDTLNSKIIGQPQAILPIVRAIKRSKLDLQDPNRPLASFLFVGTTGVGKTETAKVLASVYFGNEKEALIRFDMSEYPTPETVHRLTGSSPGYVGYSEGGQLTNAVKNTPYCVVLFDEIEKAHPDVLNILLQILDDGRLTDSSGFTVNFKNTIVILTTNIGANAIQKQPLGFENEHDSLSNEKIVLSEVKKALRPELINRLSNIVVFNSLSKADCESIVEIYLNAFKAKLKKQGITLKISPTVKTKIVEIGYSETYGAREIKRVFEKEVVDVIADIILTNDIHSIYIDSSDDKLNFFINNSTNIIEIN